MDFILEPITVTGYHGTTRKFAEEILSDDFVASVNEWDWLGHGVYFWQDAPLRAYQWAERQIEGPDPPVVVAARIRLDGFVDLLDQRGMSILQEFAQGYQRLYAQRRLSNVRGANRLDCAVFNFTTGMLSSLGIEVNGYRAACVEGGPLTPGSPIFELSHVQIVVANRNAIL